MANSTKASVKPSEDVLERARVELLQSRSDKQKLREYYAKEEKKPIYLSPMYQPYFGRNMDVTICGIHIYMPVDGSTHLVPKTFAAEIARRRMAVDCTLQKQRRMADVTKNQEGAPGELTLF